MPSLHHLPGWNGLKKNFKEPVEIIGPYNSLEEIDKEEVTRGFKALGGKGPGHCHWQ